MRLRMSIKRAAGKLVGLDADQVAGKFTEMLASPLTMGFWMVVVVAIGIFVCARGLQNGLEKVTKVMMIALLVIMVVLAVNSMFMPGAKEGLTFFLVTPLFRMSRAFSLAPLKQVTSMFWRTFQSLSFFVPRT